jgi:hypothetical protein
MSKGNLIFSASIPGIAWSRGDACHGEPKSAPESSLHAPRIVSIGPSLRSRIPDAVVFGNSGAGLLPPPVAGSSPPGCSRLINTHRWTPCAQYIAVHSVFNVLRIDRNTLFYIILFVRMFFDRMIRTRMDGAARADTYKFCTVLSTESVHNLTAPFAASRCCKAARCGPGYGLSSTELPAPQGSARAPPR